MASPPLAPAGSSSYNSDTMTVGDGTWDRSKNTFLLPNLVGLNFDTMRYNGITVHILDAVDLMMKFRHGKSLSRASRVPQPHSSTWSHRSYHLLIRCSCFNNRLKILHP